jgi:hypothetical protein
MKSLNKIIILTAVCALFFISCEEDYGSRKKSTPVIEAASISPTAFTFGDSVTLTASITDPATLLYALDYTLATAGKTIASGSIPLGDTRVDVSQRIFVPLISDLPDNTPVTVTLTARNVLKGAADKDFTGFTGKRPVYSQLYLVTTDGQVAELKPQAANKDKYEATGLTFDATFDYKIAGKITAGKEIDYSSAVWGNLNGRIAIIDNKGEPAFATAPNSGYMNSFVFDSYAFTVSVAGGTLGANDLSLNDFGGTVIDGELFRTLNYNLVKNQEYTLFGKLADEKIVYHLDFFERTAANKIRFLGETGAYTLYYNTYRQHMLLWVDNPAYPDYILITGGGIGYPTKVSGIDKSHCWWGFGHIRQFILPRKIANDVFQATFYIHWDEWNWMGFKPFENNWWANEKGFSAVTITGEDVLEGNNDNNFISKSNIDTNAFYRLTFDWAASTLHVEKIILD